MARGNDQIEVKQNPLYEHWSCTDQLVCSWIFGTLSEEVLHTLLTSRDVWLCLAENFNKIPLSRYSLKLLTEKDKNLAVYCREFKTVCESLSAIRKPVEESMIFLALLMASAENTIRLQQWLRAPCLSFQIQNLTMLSQRFIALMQNCGHMKMYEKLHLILRSMLSKKVTTKSTSPTHCHTIPHHRGRSGFSRVRGGYTTRGRGFTQHQTTPNTQGERPTCQICGRIGHTALKCYNRFDNNYQSSQTYTSVLVTDETGEEWFPDSGASAHITSSVNNLQEAHSYEGNDVVMVGNGAYLPVTHIGSTTLNSSSGTLSLNEVLVCLDIKKSPLSFSK